MALIYKGNKGAICGREIDITRRGSYVATTHLIGDPNDPLHRLSDAAMHYDSFQEWPHRTEFVEQYNITIGRAIWGNGSHHRALARVGPGRRRINRDCFSVVGLPGDAWRRLSSASTRRNEDAK